MTTEDKLKKCILDKHGSLIDFCNAIDMPTSSLSTIFKRGVMSSSTTTMIKICNGLGIDVQSLAYGEIVYVDRSKKPIDLLRCVELLEFSDEVFIYKHRELSRDERAKVSFALKALLEQLNR